MERKENSDITLSLGSDVDTNIRDLYQQYVDKYGLENADYIMAATGAWEKNYQRAVYLDLGIGDGEKIKSDALNEAKNRGWRFENIKGDMLILKHLLTADWDEDFLILNPGEQVRISYDVNIITSLKPE